MEAEEKAETKPLADRFPALAVCAVLCLTSAGCRMFPAGMYVEREFLDELERTHFDDVAAQKSIAARMSARLGYTAGPAELVARGYHRLDLGRSARDPDELDAVGGPLTEGLRSGDIVLAKNLEAQGLGQTLALSEFTYYDHVGVLVVDGDAIYVYESWPTFGSVLKGGDLASHFEGVVARVPLSCFARRYEVIEVVRLGEPERNERIARAARKSLQEEIRFDPYHDPDRPELSCSEYAQYLIVDRAGYPFDIPLTPATTNPSMSRARASLGFRMPAYLMPDSFADLPGAEHVGWISRHASLSENLAVREAYALLFERFTASSWCGDYLAPDRFHLVRYRDTTLAFLEWAKGYFRHNPATDPDTIRPVLERMVPIFFVPRS